MNVECLTVGEIQANCWVVWSEPKQAIVIDPGAEPSRILAFLKEHGLEVAAYGLTHGHVDHIDAISEMYASRPAPIGIHPADLEWAFSAADSMPPFYAAPNEPPEVARQFKQGQEWSEAGLKYRIIETPGHTPGSVCLLFDEHSLFCGDTLFAGSVGRTDLPGGSSRSLTQSLATLAALPDSTKVYPGHGPTTTIGREKQTNYFMQSGVP